MAKETKTTEKDGVVYVLDTVKSGKVVVGLAPTPKIDDLDALLAVVEPEAVFKLAYSQLRTNHKNVVRAKFNTKGVKASAVLDALKPDEDGNSVLTTTEIIEHGKKTGQDFTDAAMDLLRTDPDPEKIHWDVLN
jgi:hypothetical protein